MPMTIYALDSNIISYYLKGDKKLIERINNEVKNGGIVVPPVVYFEVKKWLLKNKAQSKLMAFEDVLVKYGVDEICKEVLDISLSIFLHLQANGITIDDADVVIAGYCIQNGYTLVTNNMKKRENDGESIYHCK